MRKRNTERNRDIQRDLINARQETARETEIKRRKKNKNKLNWKNNT